MTTKRSRGRITGLLALTFEAQEALVVGDPVTITGDYEVHKSDGTAATIGHVSIANVMRDRVTSMYPVSAVPGDVTVEVRGFEVRRVTKTAAAFAAGSPVGWNSSGKLAAVASGAVNQIGWALMASQGVDDDVDVLVR